MISRWWRAADQAGGGLWLDLVLYAAGAAFAAITAVTSTLPPHRAWGGLAVAGYAAAAVATAAQFGRPVRLRARAAVAGLAWIATTLAPLVVLAVQRAGGRLDRAQEEVLVVEQGGHRLLATGTPYLARDDIAALPPEQWLLGYLPYQPGMALFGLPHALAGSHWWTDARVWFALATAVALAAATAVLRRPATAARAPGRGAADRSAALLRGLQGATVLPICALTLATGGDDLPVLALCLLSLSLCARDRYGAAGLAAGLAGALKLFAWPVALVLCVLAATARRPRFALGALGLPLLAAVPAALLDHAALLDNVLWFPLGDGLVESPARSPFPGRLIAEHLPAGGAVALGLLLAAGGAIAVLLWRRPPRTAAAAAVWCAWGLLVGILLMPSTRFGYLLYPAALGLWAAALAPPGGVFVPHARSAPADRPDLGDETPAGVTPAGTV